MEYNIVEDNEKYNKIISLEFTPEQVKLLKELFSIEELHRYYLNIGNDINSLREIRGNSKEKIVELNVARDNLIETQDITISKTLTFFNLSNKFERNKTNYEFTITLIWHIWDTLLSKLYILDNHKSNYERKYDKAKSDCDPNKEKEFLTKLEDVEKKIFIIEEILINIECKLGRGYLYNISSKIRKMNHFIQFNHIVK